MIVIETTIPNNSNLFENLDLNGSKILLMNQIVNHF